LTLDFARTLSGRDFEEWLARLLRGAGIAEVCVTQASRDQGADLVITIGTRKIVMQAKQCQDTIGNGAVQEVLGALPYYGAAEAWVVTTSTFSKDAIDLAFRTAVRLVPGNQLLDLPAMIRGKDLPAVPEPAVMDTETAWVPEVKKALAADVVDAAVAAPAVIAAHDRGKEILAKLRK
jgi:restriction endonuclease Mrr